MFLVSGVRVIVEHCKIVQTGTEATDEAAIKSTGAGVVIRGNHIISNVARADLQGAAINVAFRAQVTSNFVESTQMGIEASSAFGHLVIMGNVFVGSGTNNGIELDSANSTEGIICHYNSVYNYTNGINIPDATDDGDTGVISIINNIIWGSGTGGDKGIANPNAATSIFAYIDNNAIGNVTTPYEFGDLIIENKIDLGANNPFDNPGGTAAVDYILNTGTGGNLCRSAAKPSDFDNNGTQDSWGDVGALQAEPTGGAGGGVMLLTGLIG
jgi:hypothetical protein